MNNHKQGAMLYKNNQDGSFTDVAAEVGVYIESWDKHASSWVDFDNDGDKDLFVSCGAERGKGEVANLLYVNHKGKRVENAVF